LDNSPLSTAWFWRGWAVRIAPFALVLALWFALTRGAMLDPVFLPPPEATFRSFVSLLSGQFLTEHFGPSVFRVGLAFLCSVAVAFPLGIASGQFPPVARFVLPLCGFMRYLPVAAFVPLCILWFGIDHQQKIAVIVAGVVFQLTLLFAADTASVPVELVETGRTFGFSRFQIVRRIVLPWSMPAIWDDLRISAGWAWSYLVLAELVAGNRGVGYFIVQSQRYLETDRVFAGILFVGILGALTDYAFRFSRQKLFRWA
jgi:NitT/TauT family transport system permease protein